MLALLTHRLVPNCRKHLRRVAAKFNNLRNTQLMKSAQAWRRIASSDLRSCPTVTNVDMVRLVINLCLNPSWALKAMKRRELIIPSDILQRTRRTARGYYKSSFADEAAIIRISPACRGPKTRGTCLKQALCSSVSQRPTRSQKIAN